LTVLSTSGAFGGVKNLLIGNFRKITIYTDRFTALLDSYEMATTFRTVSYYHPILFWIRLYCCMVVARISNIQDWREFCCGRFVVRCSN